MLCSAICLLRMLREQKQNGLQQVWIIGGFTLFCVLFTVENIPQLIGSALHLFAEYVIFPLLMVVISVVGFLFYGFVQVLVWLMLLLRGEEPGPLQVDNRGMAEVLQLEEFVDEGGSSPFLRYLGYFLLVLLVGSILYLLLRFLLGEKETEPGEQVIREITTKLPSQKVQNHSLLPPRDPRLQVRWYYAKFLRECRKRHVFFAPGDTTADIAQKCSFAFPECDPQILRRLYLPARYSMKTAITRADAEAAANAWHTLKKSKAPY